jgi:hypothetical protein
VIWTRAVLLGAFVLALPSCYCTQAAHKQDALCVIEQSVIDCSKGEAGPLISTMAVVLETLITNSSNVDWSALEQKVESAGLKDGGCILAAIEADATKNASASPEQANKVQQITTAFGTWKQKKGVGHVRFKLQINNEVVYR